MSQSKLCMVRWTRYVGYKSDIESYDNRTPHDTCGTKLTADQKCHIHLSHFCMVMEIPILLDKESSEEGSKRERT